MWKRKKNLRKKIGSIGKKSSRIDDFFFTCYNENMNYVMSDIHGHLKEFNKMLKLIKFSKNDHLYILGDYVDKGPDSMGLIKKVMKMKNVTCLLGNHDHMMYTYLKCDESNDFSKYRGYCLSWLYQNDGERTLEAYEKLKEEDKTDIYYFLSDLVVAIPDLVVGEKHFYLVHSMPEKKTENVVLMYDTGDELDDVKHYIWDRWRDSSWLWKPLKNKTVIAGHSISRPEYRISEKGKGYYNIDCGCAQDKRLGCLRLEDMEEFYVESEKYEEG